MNKKILMSIIGIIVIASLFLLLGNGLPTTTGSIVGESNSIKISLSEVSTTAKFYDYKCIEYFVVKAIDGSVKTAFNACDVCYKSKKGYRQEGNDMVCNNCGNFYPISVLGTKNLKGGGCWPGYLPSSIEGDYLVIQKSDLEEGDYRF
jgi:uncharacterized membrane protein